jgi:hypothetical protein
LDDSSYLSNYLELAKSPEKQTEEIPVEIVLTVESEAELDQTEANALYYLAGSTT